MGILPRPKNIGREICRYFWLTVPPCWTRWFFLGCFFLPLGCLRANQRVAIFLFIIHYSLFIFSLFDTILVIFFETSTSIASLLSLLTCYWYACMFPYLRYLAAKKNVDEVSKTSSFLIGFVLCLLALTPSLILAFATKTIVA